MSQDWIERNKEQFGVQIIELKKIIENQVLASGKSDEFTSDMYVALISGRKITEKMDKQSVNITIVDHIQPEKAPATAINTNKHQCINKLVNQCYDSTRMS